MSSPQEMLYKEQPQPEPMPQVQEEKKFAGGGRGGGGAPKVWSFSSSSSSSVTCRTDPENPGQQICKKVTRQHFFDPVTGKQQQSTSESDEYRQPSVFGGGGFSSFLSGGNDGGNFYNGPQNRNFENQQQPSIIDRLQASKHLNQNRKNFLNLGNDNIDPDYYQYQQQQQQNQSEYNQFSQNAFQPQQNQMGQFSQTSMGGVPGSPYDPYNAQNEYDRLITRQMNPFRLIEESERQIRSLLGDDFGHPQSQFSQEQGFHNLNRQGDIFDELEKEFFGRFGGMSGFGGLGNGSSRFGPSFEDDQDDYRQRHQKGQGSNFNNRFGKPQVNSDAGQNFNQMNRFQQPQQQQRQQLEEEFKINQTVNPLQGIKFSGKIYDV